MPTQATKGGVMDGKGCECFARCESDCICDADWTPEEVYRLRAAINELSRKNLNGMCEAFYRVIEAYHSKASPFQNPVARDAAVALRELRGMCHTIRALAAKEE